MVFNGNSQLRDLISVTSFVGNALDNGNFCPGIFQTSERLLIHVHTVPILLTKLSKLCVNGITLQWFHSYLTDHHQRVKVTNHLSSSAPINCGFFQSSIWDPLLLCYKNDIHCATDLATFLFADDTFCLDEHKKLHTFKANKIAVNVSKTN